MLDPAVIEFFDDRKATWLKKNIKASMAQLEIDGLGVECEQLFSLPEWLPKAAKRAGQISMATHPCTFSHPSARKNINGYVSSVRAQAAHSVDGYLRTGNVTVDTDAVGNAAAMDVYKFLSLTMQDGQSLLSHIEKETDLATDLLKLDGASYQSLRKGFLALVENSGPSVTSSKIKQVFFPVSGGYHQLSLLSNSGMMYQLRLRLDNLRFSEEVKSLRELKRRGDFSEQGFKAVYKLTTIGYGGTKPQNISVMNAKNNGKSHLLQSLPPNIEHSNTHFPKTNFFAESMRYYEFRDSFQVLHKIFKNDYNSINRREGSDYRLQEVVDHVIFRMWAVRAVAKEQYSADSSNLKRHQKVWLCDDMSEERQGSDQWLDKLSQELLIWIVDSYELIMGALAIKLGERERANIVEIIAQNREGLR